MPENLLDCHNVSKLRQAVADRNSRAIERLPFDTISIGALVEICCANYYWRKVNDEDGIEVFRRLALIVPTLNTISEQLLRAIREPTGCQFQPGESNLVLNVVAQKRVLGQTNYEN
jgi:hypothetical protein